MRGLPVAAPSEHIRDMLGRVVDLAECIAAGGRGLASSRAWAVRPTGAASGVKEDERGQSVLELSSNPLSRGDVERLLRCRGADRDAVIAAADRVRQLLVGDTVSYVVNRNINYTNVCTYK